MKNKHPPQDKNFDDLAARFNRNIYSTLKGQLRLAVLKRDFAECVPGASLSILDVGAGQGHWAKEMLRQGHKVLLSDVSAEMLAVAEANLAGSDLTPEQLANAEFLQAPLQALPELLKGRAFDMVVCHALLEWLNEPEAGLEMLKGFIKPGGWLSLIVYNQNGLLMKNLLRTNYKKVLTRDFRGYRGSLTPSNPLTPQQVKGWLQKQGYEEVCFSGIRTFHDYILNKSDRERDSASLTQLELELSRVSPYRELGRYLHFLSRR